MIHDAGPNLKIFRDDLFPFLGGGNKGRKMQAIGLEILASKSNAIVTTGGIQSNHCRAVAVFAAMHKMKCTLVLHGNKELFLAESGNAKIMRHSGATLEFVENPQQIGEFMDRAMESYRVEGRNPYYLWGGGHTLAGGKAYIDAILELKAYCETRDYLPDYIFHASGTGSTQSGLLAGLDQHEIFKDTKVIGISVARKSAPAQEVVANFYRELCTHYGLVFLNRETIVLDDYLCGGYDKYDAGLKELSVHALRDFGFILDTTYSGKAFYGMQQYLQNREIRANVLFWHTGGIFNFLAH